MPFCTECGNNYPNDAKFCPHCGKPNKLLTIAKTPNRDGDTELRQKTDVSGGGSYGLNVNNLPNGTALEKGRYTILEKLGEGGFGVVYKASDAHYDGIFKALKVIYSENYSDRLVMHKLKTEAKNMISINHPNVVRLYDIHFEGEIKFLDMEFIDGGDLVDLMLNSPDNKIPEEKVWELATQIAQGMQAIHSVNIIHQDLKPENILLTQEGLVKITDFGISETFRTFKSRIEESDVKGTFVYASPEQLIGKNIGKEADVWSFGATLYHILTGGTLYSGDNSNDLTLQIEKREYTTIIEASEKLNVFLSKCLERDYHKRFKSFIIVIDFISNKNQFEKSTGRKRIDKMYKKLKNRFISVKKVFPKKAIKLFMIIIIPIIFFYSYINRDAFYYNLGCNYEYGEYGFGANTIKAIRYYKKSALLGNVGAQYILGRLYKSGDGIEKNYQEAFKWFKLGAYQGCHDCQAEIGEMYDYGYGVKEDNNEAVKWYEKAAEGDVFLAHLALKNMYFYGDQIQQDYEKAFMYSKIFADKGYPSEQLRIGVMYDYGYGVKENDVEAVKWYKMSSEDEYYPEDGLNNLGVMYLKGSGVEKDYKMAKELFLKASSSSSSSSSSPSNNLGYMYEKGYGTNQDYDKAFECYSKSADLGCPNAEYNIGYMYENGLGVEKDDIIAFDWYRKSAISFTLNHRLSDKIDCNIWYPPRIKEFVTEMKEFRHSVKIDNIDANNYLKNNFMWK